MAPTLKRLFSCCEKPAVPALRRTRFPSSDSDLGTGSARAVPHDDIVEVHACVVSRMRRLNALGRLALRGTTPLQHEAQLQNVARPLQCAERFLCCCRIEDAATVLMHEAGHVDGGEAVQCQRGRWRMKNLGLWPCNCARSEKTCVSVVESCCRAAIRASTTRRKGGGSRRLGCARVGRDCHGSLHHRSRKGRLVGVADAAA